jgi:3-hydroxyisobutyrate dehydrogenase-like beta-hydroxyacid dehydrogenase
VQNGFAIDLAFKDVGHIASMARQAVCPLPLVDMASNHLLAAKAKHGGDIDWGALHLAVRDAAGLPPINKEQA